MLSQKLYSPVFSTPMKHLSDYCYRALLKKQIRNFQGEG
jgi:hypothetical protein